MASVHSSCRRLSRVRAGLAAEANPRMKKTKRGFIVENSRKWNGAAAGQRFRPGCRSTGVAELPQVPKQPLGGSLIRSA